MKKFDVVLKEYVRNLSDDDFRFLSVRLAQNIPGDLPEVADFLSRNKEIDRWLSSATSSSEWFAMIDYLGEFVSKELKRRSVLYNEAD